MSPYAESTSKGSESSKSSKRSKISKSPESPKSSRFSIFIILKTFKNYKNSSPGSVFARSLESQERPKHIIKSSESCKSAISFTVIGLIGHTLKFP